MAPAELGLTLQTTPVGFVMSVCQVEANAFFRLELSFGADFLRALFYIV